MSDRPATTDPADERMREIADHWPVVDRLHSGEWGVHCLACSTTAGDHVPRCLVFADDWPPLVLREAPRCDLMEAKAEAAARASGSPGDDGSPTPDVGAAEGGDDGSATESEPRVHYQVEAYNDGWSVPIHTTHSLDAARAHEGLPPGSRASTRIVRVTREVIQ